MERASVDGIDELSAPPSGRAAVESRESAESTKLLAESPAAHGTAWSAKAASPVAEFPSEVPPFVSLEHAAIRPQSKEKAMLVAHVDAPMRPKARRTMIYIGLVEHAAAREREAATA
jgi:hypothetical protein